MEIKGENVGVDLQPGLSPTTKSTSLNYALIGGTLISDNQWAPVRHAPIRGTRTNVHRPAEEISRDQSPGADSGGKRHCHLAGRTSSSPPSFLHVLGIDVVPASTSTPNVTAKA